MARAAKKANEGNKAKKAKKLHGTPSNIIASNVWALSTLVATETGNTLNYEFH